MNFEHVRKVADAVLLEGYVLYPYRASAPKNRYRWQFGVLVPKAHGESDPSERWWAELQCLVEGRIEDISIRGFLRFLQLRKRTLEKMEGDRLAPAEGLVAGKSLLVPWEEGDVREIEVSVGTEERVLSFHLGGGREESWLVEGDRTVGRVVHERWPVFGTVQTRLEPLGEGLCRLRILVENHSEVERIAGRDEALRSACLSTHLLLAVEGGAFVSPMDPPPSLADEASRCRSVGLHPVLAGEEGRRDLLLASPIILYDHPRIAPESPADFFDATEIDELLVLRTSTLTEDEKREMRGTDPRAAALLERVESISPDEMSRLHGAIREGPTPLPSPGAKVKVLPGRRRSDAQDMLFFGCVATVEKWMEDVDGRIFLAVTLDDDPASDLHRGYGRYLFYYPDEVEALTR